VACRYFLGGPSEDKVESNVDSALDKCCQIAKKHGIDLVPGTIVARDPKDGFVYNNCYYIDCSGKVLLSYRKVHLWHPERALMTKGDEFNTCKNRFGIQVGLCVCWDIAFPEAFREMALRKHAQLIIAPGNVTGFISRRNTCLHVGNSLLDIGRWWQSSNRSRPLV
jgi:predicted amidohydrolase